MLASHLSVPAILVTLKGRNCVNLARIITEHILQGYSHQVDTEFMLACHQWNVFLLNSNNLKTFLVSYKLWIAIVVQDFFLWTDDDLRGL